MQAPARNWFTDGTESAHKKVKVREDEKLLSDSEKLAKLEAEQEREEEQGWQERAEEKEDETERGVCQQLKGSG